MVGEADPVRRQRSSLAATGGWGRRLAAVLVVLLTAAPPSVGRASEAANEYQVKAAFLLNFARFTEWPAAADSDGKPLVVGIVGDDPFGSILDEIVAAETVGGRALEVRRFSAADIDGDACDVLFVGSWTDPELERLLARLDGTGVLTVGETEAFAERGGIIALVTEQARVRFVVNVDAVSRSPLKLSSKLLTLARIVKGGTAERASGQP